MKTGDCELETVELKVKVEGLNRRRRRLISLNALHMGSARHRDVYFHVPDGKLKIREFIGEERYELIFYEERHVSGLRRKRMFTMDLGGYRGLMDTLQRILERVIVVDKRRDLYLYRETIIGLDEVDGLGGFVELKRMAPADEEIGAAIREFRRVMRDLGIEGYSPVYDPYSSLLMKRRSEHGAGAEK